MADYPLPWRAQHLFGTTRATEGEKGIAIMAANNARVKGWWDDEAYVPPDSAVCNFVNYVNSFAPDGPFPNPWLAGLKCDPNKKSVHAIA